MDPTAKPTAADTDLQSATPLTGAAILQSSDMLRERVDCPEWGGHLYVRSLTGFERDRWETSLFEMKGKTVIRHDQNIRARLLAICACDGDGNPLFTAEQAQQLGEKSAKALDRCFDVAQRLSGLSNEEVEKLEGN